MLVASVSILRIEAYESHGIHESTTTSQWEKERTLVPHLDEFEIVNHEVVGFEELRAGRATSPSTADRPEKGSKERSPTITSIPEAQCVRWPNSPEQMRPHSHALEPRSCSSQDKESPHSSVQRRATQNDYFPVVPSTVGAGGTPAQQVLSPEQFYAPTPYSLGSNDSLVLGTRSSLPQPTFNVAIAKWFDMLVGDSDFENAISSFDVSGDGLDPTKSQDLNHISSSRRVSAISDAPGANGIPPSLHLQLLERNTHSQDRVVTSEKLRWQLSHPIELMPHEHFIFQNFVQRISHWVWAHYFPVLSL
ncbi:hypothetical protein ACMFMG_004852 [Clarireedia jacksonii]